MGVTCAICHTTGTKGYFRIPSDYRQNEWLSIAGLPADLKDVQGKRICFRHFQSKFMVFVGNALKVTKGKFIKIPIKLILQEDYIFFVKSIAKTLLLTSSEYLC